MIGSSEPLGGKGLGKGKGKSLLVDDGGDQEMEDAPPLEANEDVDAEGEDEQNFDMTYHLGRGSFIVLGIAFGQGVRVCFKSLRFDDTQKNWGLEDLLVR